MLYFAIDGNFGDATDLLTVSFEWWQNLPEEVKGNINEMSDTYRYDYVEHLAKDLHSNGFADCETCKVHLS